MSTIQQIEAAVRSPNFAYGRAGDRLFRGMTMIYHRHPESPSGVLLECAGEAAIVDPLIRKHQLTSALSPTER
jgi:hypothetical protein